MKANFTKPVSLSILSGLLLIVAWPVSPFTAFIFIALVPLLWLTTLSLNRLQYTALIYLSMLTWNTGTTWWIWNSTAEGALSAILANSLLMTLPWLGYFSIRQHVTPLIANIALVCFWMGFEYLHLQDWGLSWPWLTLGNVFADVPEWIQWYEYTGSSGGTLWIWISNLAAFALLRNTGSWKQKIFSDNARFFLSLLLLPILLSKGFMPNEKQKTQPGNVVVVQPNVDPYKEKFAEGTQLKQIETLIRLTDSMTDTNTRLVVWPETAIPVQVWEDEIPSNIYYQPVWDFLARHPQISILTGIDSYRRVEGEEVNDFSTRNPEGTNFYYKAYNTAALLSAGKQYQLYHKSKLVPGVETLPSWLNWMGKIFESFGGISGTLATDKERVVLQQQNGFHIAPAICYESIYGEFLTSYVRKGANVIGIITNDGWWGNTPGHKQHMHYARLRAIETRRWVIRSANTGISCFIDPAGQIFLPQPWWTQTAISMYIPPSNEQTFYVRYGDLLSKTALFIGLITLLFLFSRIWISRKH